MNLDVKDLGIRFIFGGSAVLACYIVSRVVPWASFAGIFAAFPAVMAAAVIMTGTRHGDEAAGDVAFGAVAGMIGCTFCVASALWFMAWLNSWQWGLTLSLVVWFAASAASISVMQRIQARRKASRT